MSRQTDVAARAIRGMILKAVDRVALADFGIVRQVNPVSVELGYANEVLDSDELIVTQAVRQYDKDHGLVVGDSLALVPTESGEMMAVGVISEKPLAAAAVTTTEMDAAIAAAVAAAGAAAWLPGDLKPTTRGGAVPSGWLLCDGSPVSRTTYAALFAAISTDYNVGGESGTQFRLPDGIGRSLIGAGLSTQPTKAADATTHARGSYGGTETHVLTLAQLPAHDHSPTANGLTGSTTPGVGGAATVSGTTDQNAAANTGASFVALPNAGTAGTVSNPGGLAIGFQWGTSISAGVTGYDAATPGSTAHVHAAPQHTHAFTAQGSHQHTGAAHTHSLTTVGTGTAHPNLSPFFTGAWLIKT